MNDRRTLNMCYKGGDKDGNRPGWKIKFPYEAELIEELKRRVPHTAREWHGDDIAKYWWVSEAFEDVLDEMFSNFYALAKLQGTLF